MQCPICGAIAQNITRADHDGLGVRCKNCRDFEVDTNALNALLRLSEPDRVAALERARQQGAEPMPAITKACF